MGKETVKNTYVLQEDENIGTVQIADEVVAIIASLAATEVEGVSSMAGNITNELMSKFGVKGLTKKVQERVKNEIENMTGLTVTDVNIRIAGVNMSAGKH